MILEKKGGLGARAQSWHDLRLSSQLSLNLCNLDAKHIAWTSVDDNLSSNNQGITKVVGWNEKVEVPATVMRGTIGLYQTT